ncbi:MAG: polysaccharide biosynthesis tyrosine autokinase [Marinilabiliaceae bacterium]|nr:polysaccharide biosynthesis tyrosine autokinase [Marinilabiliaceae bacterium]
MTESNQHKSIRNIEHASAKTGTDGLFDLNRIIHLLQRNWYLFLISFPLCFGSVYFYHRYTIPVYKASATILLKSADQTSLQRSDLIEGFGLSPEVKSIENQTFIIRSKKLIKKAIDRLDFDVAYFKHGRIKDTELYRSSPFHVEFDSLHPQLINVPFYITCVQPGIFRIECISEGGALHHFVDQKNVGYLRGINLSQEVKPNELIQGDGYSFRIKSDRLNSSSAGEKFYFIFKSHSQLTGEFRGKLGVNSYSEGSSILFISAVGTSAVKIKTFLDVLCEVILEYNLDRKNDMATRSLDFIQSQLVTVSDTLEKVQNQLLAYRKANRFMGPTDFSEKLASQYFEGEKDLKLLEIQEEYYKFLKSNMNSAVDLEQYMLPAVDDESAGLINQLVMQLIALNEEQEIVDKDAESKNPYVGTLERKIDVTSDNLGRAINQVLKSIELEKKEVQSALEGLLQDMDKLPDLEKHYLKIDRTYKLNDAIYTFLLQKYSETQIAKASNVPDNEIIDNASISAIVSPNKKSNYSRALLLALLIPAGLIVLREFLNRKVRGRDDLDYLIPDVPLMGLVVHNKSNERDVIHSHPHTVISESFRSIRTKLRFMAGGSNNKVITLTSTNTGEGKTFCAQNLAAVFSISGKKTVLLGFDMRKPRLSDIYDLNHNAGLSNYLVGQVQIEDIIYSGGYDDLYVIPAGAIPPNPSELITGDRTAELFKYLRANFDVVVVDSPPIGLVADARLLMQYADTHLFVVRSHYTLKDHMVHTIQNLRTEGVQSLGVVLNDISIKDKGYGYYSSEYYGGNSN